MQNFENKRANQKCCTAQDQTSLKTGFFMNRQSAVLSVAFRCDITTSATILFLSKYIRGIFPSSAGKAHKMRLQLTLKKIEVDLQ